MMSVRDTTFLLSPSRRQFLRSTLSTAGAASLAAAAPLAAASSSDPLATTRSGRIRGQTLSGVHSFKGIPYGADTRSRRFQTALDVPEWKGIRNATEYGNWAPQTRPGGPISEDCLFLNVWTPGLRDEANRPVIVYIHGGGYTNGSGAGAATDGVHLCQRGDVVVVTVNHRINAFGYLYLANLGDERFAQSGNIGQLDLVKALQWIKQHAEAFGGNPNNITLVGQSGGGAKISTLMAMPVAKGLFQRAVTMSGQQVTAAGPRAATQRATRFMEALGLKPGDSEKLLALPMEALLDATQTQDFSRIEDRPLEFLPVFDSSVLPRHPFYPDAPDQSAGVPMIIGNTRDETTAFSRPGSGDFSLSWEELPEKIRKHQYVDIEPEVVIAEYRRLYPQYSPSDIFFAATTAGRSWRGAVIQAEARARQGAPAYVYQLNWHPDNRVGAGHGSDLSLMFNNVHVPEASTESRKAGRSVSDTMSDALLAFARTGEPNHPGMPEWKPYSLEQRQTLIFDTPTRMENDPRGAERRFYAQVPFVLRGTF